MSLREAIGASGRTPDPFTSWWRESTVLLPVFVFAVLAAVTLALRWFGPVLRDRRAVVVTVLLIAAAGTLAGLAAKLPSAYDYHLQVAQLPKMNAMRGVCGPSCLDAQERLTLGVHVRGVVYISRWLLLTNLVLVAWIVAMMGGRLGPPHPATADGLDRPADDVWQPCGGLAPGAGGGTGRQRCHPRRCGARAPHRMVGRRLVLRRPRCCRARRRRSAARRVAATQRARLSGRGLDRPAAHLAGLPNGGAAVRARAGRPRGDRAARRPGLRAEDRHARRGCSAASRFGRVRRATAVSRTARPSSWWR